jgi:aminomethyltransferase
LRLEKGFCLYGNDIDDTTSPIEAGLGWITKFKEGKEFIDRTLLEKQKTSGVSRKLVRFELKGRGIPRHEYEIVNENNEKIGHVTSGTMLPDSKKGIGMGYVQTAYSKPGATIFIKIRANNMEAVVVK